MSTRALVLTICAGLSLGAAALAQPAADVARPAKPKKALQILTPAQIDAALILPPPPVEMGPVHKAELAELHRIIAAATPERMAQARWDDDHEDPSAFYAVMGKGFDLKTLPATAELMAVVMNDQAVAASAAKNTFPRNRPWTSDATVKTCDPNDKPLKSYPSGHATMGFTVALVLARLVPEKAQALQTRAMDYAFSREVCGSHYPADTEASHVLAAVLATDLLASPALQDKIAAAKAELRRSGLTSR